MKKKSKFIFIKQKLFILFWVLATQCPYLLELALIYMCSISSAFNI